MQVQNQYNDYDDDFTNNSTVSLNQNQKNEVVSKRKLRIAAKSDASTMDASTRSAILLDMRQQQIAETKLRNRQVKYDLERKQNMVWQKALMDASISNGICNMSWLNFGQIDPVVYDFQKNFKCALRELRLVGMGLTEISDDLGNKLKTLEVLSLTGNHLITLPNNIVNLTKLRELQLVKNKIEYLPDRIGLLASLTTLGLAKNCLKRLPLTFGALNLIIRVDLECNDLKFLPENMDQMISCTYLNVNNNKLFRLPKCIGRMPSLKVFSASSNFISYIPEEFCDNKTITTLRLAVNKLTKLPDNLGNLTHLEELTVDFNEILKIPNTIRMLKKLRILRIEGNNLRDPPDQIVLDGALSVVEYFQQLYDSDVQWRMRLVVTSLQNVLRQLIERDMYDPSMLEPNTILPHDSQKDLWTAIDDNYLIDTCLPALRLIWRQEGLQKGGRKNTGYISNFPYTQKDIIWACSGFGDAYGPVMTKMKANFKKCSCCDDVGRRKPCNPPIIGYMCHKMCTLYKMRIIQKSDKSERLWVAYKEHSIADAIKRANHEALEYLHSKEGSLNIEKLAIEKADEILGEALVDNAVAKREQEAKLKKEKVIKKWNALKAKVQKKKDRKVAEFDFELNELKTEHKELPLGYLKTELENRISSIMIELARMEETVEIARLQTECEREVDLIESELYDDNSTSDSGDSDMSPPPSDDDSPEAVRKRIKYEKKMIYEDKMEEMERRKKIAKEKKMHLREIEDATPLELLDDAVTAVGQFIYPTDPRSSFQREKKIKKIKKKINNYVEIAKMRLRKMYIQSGGDYDLVQKQARHELYYQYIADLVNDAKQKAINEFSAIDRIRDNIRGSGLSGAFREWKIWTKTKKSRARKDARLKWKTEFKTFDSMMASVTSAQIQVDLWIKGLDIFTDKLFWKHKYTNEITMEKPGVYHYLPPDFKIPVPPQDLPEGVTLESTDEDNPKKIENNIEEEENEEEEEEESNSDSDTESYFEGNNSKLYQLQGGFIKNDSNSLVSSQSQSLVGGEVGFEEAPDEGYGYDERGDRLYGERPPTRSITTPKDWSILSSNEFDDNNTIGQYSSISKFSYGPDSLTVGKLKNKAAAKLLAVDTELQERSVVSGNASLDAAVEKAYAFMDRPEYKAKNLFPDINRTSMAVVRQQIADRSELEKDLGERTVRKKRNKFNQARLTTFMDQKNRRVKTPPKMDWTGGAQRLEVIEKVVEKKFQRPSYAEILTLIGGDSRMTWKKGSDALELRDTLAHRGMHVKARLEEINIKAGLCKSRKKSWWERNITPIWRENYIGTSSEESEEEDEDEKKKASRLKRRKEREERRIKKEELALLALQKKQKAEMLKKNPK